MVPSSVVLEIDASIRSRVGLATFEGRPGHVGLAIPISRNAATTTYARTWVFDGAGDGFKVQLKTKACMHLRYKNNHGDGTDFDKIISILTTRDFRAPT